MAGLLARASTPAAEGHSPEDQCCWVGAGPVWPWGPAQRPRAMKHIFFRKIWDDLLRSNGSHTSLLLPELRVTVVTAQEPGRVGLRTWGIPTRGWGEHRPPQTEPRLTKSLQPPPQGRTNDRPGRQAECRRHTGSATKPASSRGNPLAQSLHLQAPEQRALWQRETLHHQLHATRRRRCPPRLWGREARMPWRTGSEREKRGSTASTPLTTPLPSPPPKATPWT